MKIESSYNSLCVELLRKKNIFRIEEFPNVMVKRDHNSRKNSEYQKMDETRVIVASRGWKTYMVLA